MSAGVGEAVYVKVSFLAAITTDESSSPLINAQKAVQLLDSYNVAPLIAYDGK